MTSQVVQRSPPLIMRICLIGTEMVNKNSKNIIFLHTFYHSYKEDIKTRSEQNSSYVNRHYKQNMCYGFTGQVRMLYFPFHVPMAFLVW